jgi:hypothetical protein
MRIFGLPLKMTIMYAGRRAASWAVGKLIQKGFLAKTLK